MEENENEGLAGKIRKLKKVVLDTQQKGFDVLAEAAITLPKDGIKALLEKQAQSISTF